VLYSVTLTQPIEQTKFSPGAYYDGLSVSVPNGFKVMALKPNSGQFRFLFRFRINPIRCVVWYTRKQLQIFPSNSIRKLLLSIYAKLLLLLQLMFQFSDTKAAMQKKRNFVVFLQKIFYTNNYTIATSLN
jgi:hypothetical protein